jgi:hypothetical protein
MHICRGEVATERWVVILQLRSTPAFLAFQVHAEMPAGNNLCRKKGGKKVLIIHFSYVLNIVHRNLFLSECICHEC